DLVVNGKPGQALFSPENVASELANSFSQTSPPKSTITPRPNPVRGYATGGLVTSTPFVSGASVNAKGPDRIPALLAHGEFVLQRSTVDRVGPATLNALNEGRFVGAAFGGHYTQQTPLHSGSSPMAGFDGIAERVAAAVR